MPAKTSAAKRPASKKTRAGQEPGVAALDRIIDASLAEAAAVGWRRLTMDAVADRAGIALGEVLLQAPGKTYLALAFLARIDARTLGPVKRIDLADSPRDRLFEILMRRFDALNQTRDGARAVVGGAARDPAAALALLCRLDRSCAAMLEAAGISSGGLLGLVRIKGLKLVAACGLYAWMGDDSADLAKTMAAVDRALNRAEKLAGMTTFRRTASAEDRAG